MITYSWKFSELKIAPAEGNLQKIVKQVVFLLVATQDGASTHVTGVATLGEPDPKNFTPFDQITQAQAVGWVSAAVDVAALKAELAARFNAPSVATGLVSMAPPFPNT
jgi:hypothetical protein